MIIFPAVDMRNGKCVRLVQGRAEQETVYFEDPVAAAQQWEAEGAEWLHLVDLDGAMSPGGGNRAIAKKIFEALKIPVQFGGGIRKMSDLCEILKAGARRVILGTAAVEDSHFLSEALAQFSEKIVVGLDVKGGFLATKGWTQVEKLEVFAFARSLAQKGAQRIIYTDISKDGMLTGPNIAGTRRIAEQTGLKVIASGGVSSLDDLRNLKQWESYGIEGVIVGKALYEGKFSLKQALQLV